MFEFIRKHLKLVMIIFFPLVIIAFVLVGVDASMLTQRSPVVAKVGGTSINQAEWDAAQRQMADRARMNNPGISAAFLDSPQQKYAVLEQLVRDEVLRTAMQDKRYYVSNALLARTLQANPNIAALRSADGRLDMAAYRNYLAASYGMTPETFENSMRYELGLQQVVNPIGEASVSTPAQAAPSIDAFFQRRQVQSAEFLPANYVDTVRVSDEQVAQYYEQNKDKFQQPEQVDVNYVVLDLASVAKQLPITDEELRQYYESNKAAYTSHPEQRKVRHILINTTANMSAEQREEAKAKAEGILAQLQADPSKFAELAKANSEDPGSRNNGGDLGFINRGDMVPAFEEASFSLNKGQISGVVATEYGFHIIEVTDIKPAQVPSFEEIRDRIANDVKNSVARTRFIEAADTLRNVAHEQADSLEPAAQELQLTIQSAKGIGRDTNSDAPSFFNNANLKEELFSSKLLDDKFNSDAVDVGNNQIVVARIAEHRPAQILPLEAVKDQAKHELIEQEALSLAIQAGQNAEKEWTSDSAKAKLQAPLIVSRLQTNGLSGQAIEQALLAPTDKLPAFIGLEQGKNGYLVVKVERVIPANEPNQGQSEKDFKIDQEQYFSGYNQSLAQAQMKAYYNLLKEQYKVQIRVPKPADFVFQ